MLFYTVPGQKVKTTHTAVVKAPAKERTGVVKSALGMLTTVEWDDGETGTINSAYLDEVK